MKRTAVVLILAPALACALVSSLALALRPRTFASRHETIAYALEQRGVAYRAIFYQQSWPAAMNYFAYGPQIYPYSADVVLVLADGSTVHGQLACRDDRRDCSLDVPRLGIQGLDLPEVSERRSWPWLDWLEARLADLWGALALGSNGVLRMERFRSSAFASVPVQI